MVAGLNTDHMLVALLASMDAGGLATPVNIRWSPAELAAAIELTEPRAVLADQHCLPLVEKALMLVKGSAQHSTGNSYHLPVIQLEATSVQLSKLASHSNQQLQLLQPPSGAAAVIFTSGTTGRPKGVVLPHAAFHAQSLVKLAVVGYNCSDTYLHLSPLFHIGGLSSALACLMTGARHVLLPRYSPSAALDLIQSQGVTSFIAGMTDPVLGCVGNDISRVSVRGMGNDLRLTLPLLPLPVPVPAIMQDLVQAAQGAQQHPAVTLPCVRLILLGAGATSAELQVCHMAPPPVLGTAMTHCYSTGFCFAHL
jgi:acyl-activating enzyme 14